MISMTSLRREWLSNPRGDILAGIVVALALIPEAIGFSIIAGVDPRVGLYASFSIAVIISLVGGRPGMISAATAAVAVLVVPLVREHGLEYLFAATVLMGVIQFIGGLLRFDLLMRFVSRSVITGFVNALAILIFIAQLPQLIGVNWLTYPMVAAGLAVIYLFPRLTRAIPSPLVAIVVLTLAAIYFDLDVNRVGDMGELPSALPFFALPQVPFTFETMRIVFPYSLAMAAVGLLESLLTAQIVDDLTDTPSDKQREVKGQGVANFVTGFFGGMGGCAMIGQSVINVKSGGNGRLSALVAGSFLLFLIVVLGPLVAQIPMPALVAVMIMVSIGTFSRLFAVESSLSADGTTRTYRFTGQIFFASVESFLAGINFREVVEKVVIDVRQAHFWDISAVAALDKAVIKLRREGSEVEILGLNEASATMIDRFGVSARQTRKQP